MESKEDELKVWHRVFCIYSLQKEENETTNIYGKKRIEMERMGICSSPWRPRASAAGRAFRLIEIKN